MSLHENCMLVDLRITLPPQSKIAKDASIDVENRYQTAKKQGRVTKQLFSSKDIKPLSQAMNKARTLFNELSLPYDSAYRIIPSASYFEFIDKMSEVSREFDDKKRVFLRDYHIIQMSAERDLGALFDEDDYPSTGALDHMISFAIDSSVVPNVTAFDELAGLSPEAIEELKAQAVAGQNEKVEQALKDLFTRLFKSLNHASVKLADEDGVFRDTLIGNINNALTAIDSLNLTGNKDLIKLAGDVREIIEGVTPEELRKDKELRKQTAVDTQKALKKINEFF